MKRLKSILILGLILLMLTGCVAKNTEVLVTSYPAEFLVKRIAGERAQVSYLFEPGTTPQTTQISKDYESLLKKADTLVYISELQPYWEVYKEDIGKPDFDVINFSDASSLYDFKRYVSVLVNSNVVVSESSYYDSSVFDATDIYNKDPFLWMDPLAMTSMARTVRDYFVKKYPDEKQTFVANFDALEIELAQLQANFQAVRNYEQPLKAVTFSPSFGNWQRSFNIQVSPIVLSRYGALPTQAQKNVIHEYIVEHDIMYIFKEKGLNEAELKLYNEFKKQHDLTEIEVENLLFVDKERLEQNEDYITIMYKNLENLEQRP